jgi:hypothetical protein
VNDELKGFLKGVAVTAWLAALGVTLWLHSVELLVGVFVGGGIFVGVIIASLDI